MKILVLGNSDTRGAVVVGPTWPEQARREWAGRPGDVVLLDDRRFAPIGERAAAVAARFVAESQPDVVVLPLGEYVFWAASIEEQVRHIAGDRAARLYKRLERGIERTAADKGDLASNWRTVARTVARRLIGTRALLSVEDATDAYLRIFRQLAQAESIQVVVVAYPVTPLFTPKSGRIVAARRKFITSLRETAEEHRFRWLDGDAACLSAGLASAAVYHEDGVHLGQPGHDLLAVELVPLLTEGSPGTKVDASATPAPPG